jgi:hypothetical protein
MKIKGACYSTIYFRYEYDKRAPPRQAGPIGKSYDLYKLSMIHRAATLTQIHGSIFGLSSEVFQKIDALWLPIGSSLSASPKHRLCFAENSRKAVMNFANWPAPQPLCLLLLTRLLS